MPASKPSIIIIISSSRVGGPGKGIIQFLSQCEKSELSYILCTFTQNGSDDYSFTKAIRKAGLNLHVLPQKSIFDFTPIKDVIKLAKQQNCQIIQTHEYKSHIVGLFVSIALNIKWITWAHGWTNENIKIKCYNVLEKILHFFSTVAIGVSPKLYSTLRNIRLKTRPTKLILNGVDEQGIPSSDETQFNTQLQSYRTSDKDFIIGIFGRFSPEKGQDLALQAAGKLIKQHPYIKLLLVGEGQDQALLESICEKNGLQDNVIFVGYQTYVANFFQFVDLTLLPSRSEGLPNVVLESMILDTPVLATDVGGVKEIIEDGKNGWVCDAFSAEAIAQKLDHILSDKVNFEKVQSACKTSLFPKFSPDARKNHILETYKSVLKS